ncbi:hypothetical protein GCM10023113_19560 [Cellulomonas oligotrophica]|uniref:Uncharacterized protein n=2 Tax=Cellulomonas oligotrophica TaxID=931536 RepID=A0ABQ4DCV7_9CELL|nr:hypothetical protein Col01nite_27330 [Cellulomonas oligotrophica]
MGDMVGRMLREPMGLGVFSPYDRSEEGSAYDLRRLVDAIPREERAAVADYLDSAPLVVAWMCVDRDTISGVPDAVMGGSSIATDGVWIWRCEASYYVRTYGVAIPGPALTRMRQLSWRPPPLAPEDVAALERRVLLRLEEWY